MLDKKDFEKEFKRWQIPRIWITITKERVKIRHRASLKGVNRNGNKKRIINNKKNMFVI